MKQRMERVNVFKCGFLGTALGLGLALNGTMITTTVDSLKIEGIIKKFDYIYTVVHTWKKHLKKCLETGIIGLNNEILYKVFNRDFSNGLLKGEISRDLFIDNPRDNSAKKLAAIKGDVSAETVDLARAEINELRADIEKEVRNRINQLNTDKLPLTINVSGQAGSLLKLIVKSDKISFELSSQSNLRIVEKNGLDYEIRYSRLKTVNEIECD